MPTKQQTEYINRQPLAMQALIEFCGTKKLATALACELGDSLTEADRAISRCESADTQFENWFWDGRLFIDSDDAYELGIDVDTLEDHAASGHFAYDETLDATFILCKYKGRKIVAMRYEYKEAPFALSAWFLSGGAGRCVM